MKQTRPAASSNGSCVLLEKGLYKDLTRILTKHPLVFTHEICAQLLPNPL